MPGPFLLVIRYILGKEPPMSYSNRPSKFGDPTKRPNQQPFTPSSYREAKLKEGAAARKRNRGGKPGPGPATYDRGF
jgi:hypothetical protein